MNKSKTDSWSTPTTFKTKLNEEFNFDDFDPCPLNDSPDFDGLKCEWANSTFVNPPYSKLGCTKKNGMGWIQKAHLECQKGKKIVVLVPSRTDTKWFHEIVLENKYEVRFIKGRMKFGEAKNSAPFPSILIIMDGSRGEAGMEQIEEEEVEEEIILSKKPIKVDIKALEAAIKAVQAETLARPTRDEFNNALQQGK